MARVSDETLASEIAHAMQHDEAGDETGARVAAICLELQQLRAGEGDLARWVIEKWGEQNAAQKEALALAAPDTARWHQGAMAGLAMVLRWVRSKEVDDGEGE